MKIDYEITVDVSNADIETKKRVQDAFFKLGITWGLHKTRHAYLEAGIYTNTTSKKVVMPVLMWGTGFLRKPTHTIDQLFELAGMKTEKKLIPFNLEKALAGDPVVTRSGEHVSQITVFDVENEYDEQIACVVGGRLAIYHKDGKMDSGIDSRYDLFMKPKTRTVNGFEVPAPVMDPLKPSEVYFAPALYNDTFYYQWAWKDDPADSILLKRGLVFLTKKDAIANAKAMLGIDPHGGDAPEQKGDPLSAQRLHWALTNIGERQ